MKKTFKKICAVALACILAVQPMTGSFGIKQANAVGIADEFEIPAADVKGRVGATMPYTRYDSREATLSGSAAIKESKDWNPNNIASQASEQSYVALPSAGASAEWTMKTTGSGVTMRFTMPDGNGGRGQKGSVDVYVNGKKEKTVKLDSFWMWQYFNFGSGNANDSNGAVAAFAFDEVHFLLDKPLQVGDRIKIESPGGVEYGVDFLEIENVPDPIDQPDGSVSVDDYGAEAIDRDKHGDRDAFDVAIARKNTQAFKQAVADADRQGMDLYVPEGTYLLDGMWEIGCQDMKITGAGIWYTNIQFTSEERFGGGISAGNSSYVADGYCKNLEFSDMYINSGLRSRYGENAVYKAFMDIFDGGSVVHDIWEEHFECGFWIGDYNGKMDYSDGLKIINSRIRNNLADGVNFCQGTCNAVVYNCSVRNNGDDGLAMWNDGTMGAKDETNNVFAYNTIDLGWRAGLLAIYGGTGHKVYNNYLCDSFMAAGIHFNTTFPGHKFAGTTPIIFDNNILVRCGTPKECWGRDYAAVDIEQQVKNVVFNNTQIYDSPFTAIRLLGNDYSGIIFNNTTILGAGLSKQTSDYSSSGYSGCAIRENGNSSAKFNGLVVGGIVADQIGTNTKWPYYTDNAPVQNIEGNSSVTFENDITYEIPSYPDPVNGEQGGGIVDLLEGIKGYDLIVSALAWENQDGETDLKNGDKVTFTINIKNDSKIAIPEGVTIPMKVVIDGKTTLKNTKFKSGLKAGEKATVSMTSTWAATEGGHTVVATVDDTNKLPEELNENNNTRTKKFNVAEGDGSANVTRVTGGYDLVVTEITYGQDAIEVGDSLRFTAKVFNAGDVAIPAGTKIGLQFQMDGKPYPATDLTWSDTYYDGLEPGESVELTANSGNNNDGTWTALSGTHTVTAWVDDQDLFKEVNESNNETTISLTIPYGGTVFFDNPDAPDDLTGEGGSTVIPPQEETSTAPEVTGYDLIVKGVAWENESGSETLTEGDKVTFSVVVKNDSKVEIPAGKVIGFKVQVDGKTSVSNQTYKDGLKPGQAIKLTAKTTWSATYGGHTIVATVDDANKLPNELNEENNTMSKSFNVGKKEVTFNRTTGGYDLVVTGLEYGTIKAGDKVLFTAVVTNIGDQDAPSNGQPLGVRIHMDGNEGVLVWNDQHMDGLKAGESIKLTMIAGNSANNEYWSATAGIHTATVWVNDQTNRYPNEVSTSNNKTDFTIAVPSPAMIENPDKSDNLDSMVEDGEEPIEKPTEPSKDAITISNDVKIEGYQISNTLQGSRVVASVEPTINEKKVENWGLVYAITKVGDKTFTVADNEMVVGTKNEYALAIQSTPEGTTHNKFGDSKTATYYVRTMLFGAKNVKEYTAQYKVRAYAKLSDGSYVYSKVSSYNVYEVADLLYKGKKMDTKVGHNYLYNSILKVVNKDYKEKDYDWSDVVVDPDTIK